MRRRRRRTIFQRLAWLGPIALLASAGLYASCCPEGVSRLRSRSSSGGERVGDVLRGQASYYHHSLAGRPTASGQRYDPNKLTAANRRLPLGTKLRVTRVDNGKSVEVVVNDRGPFGRRRRILDLSRAAAKRLGMLKRGVAEVEAVVIETP